MFIEYYTANAPTKLSMVTEKFMEKWQGKYEILMKNLVEKYGPLGSPIQQDQVKARGPPRRKPSSASASESIDVHSHSSTFQTLILESTPSTLPPRESNLNAVEAKASNSTNGLETSTFTVCTRVRPLLGKELSDCKTYSAVVPGQRTRTRNSNGNGNCKTKYVYTESLLLHTPKVSITGNAKLETLSQEFDYVFGPQSTNGEIYELVCAPVVKRALNGQVGVIFAYGQTGSGKTHTMSGILEILCQSDVFSELTDVTFSYIEMLGRDIKDCLGDRCSDAKEAKPVLIGEALNGAVLIRNMKTHSVRNADELSRLITRANATRSMAATTKNETSSRSHGVAILKVTNLKTKVEGTLYVIDLAGSESAKDSKDHDKDRMKETKEINSSLMALKECIRARTNAAGAGADGIHVPYRRNKLTLLMKDVFDIGCSRLCSTVVIANCSPLVSDISHTKNTVKYAAPLRVAVSASNSNKQKSQELDIHDPALWSNIQIVSWVEDVVADSGKKLDAKMFVNGLTGVQFCALSENEFYARAEAQLGDTESMVEIAKKVYSGMWTLIVDAKTRKRRPDGSIITPEQEEEERRQLEEQTLEKARVWAEREKYL